MRIDAHLEKFRRFDALRQRFDPLAEFELWYWMTLSGGTAIINAALHTAGVTQADNNFATQVPNVYVEMQPDGGWSHHIHFNRDLIHVGLPEIATPLPKPIDEIFKLMEKIERYRDPCTRGLHAVTPEIINECDTAYRTLVDLAQTLLQQRPGGLP
jgi:hypothetical protein